MPLSKDFIASREFEERVYAGVLGKIIGVYLGRPFEQWPNERIERELGEVNYYVHEKLNVPLIVTDDDISGTFTFVRAFAENGYSEQLSAKSIGDWWLNTIIEKRTILWWGGIGHSTEHTAYLRLQQGIHAPESGSIALNGIAVAEEIGAQIFIDGWGMISPGDPERAADFARRAASVSHDGEAIYGAQVIAAMEALAFVEPDLNILLDKAVSLIPQNSLIAELIGNMRMWAKEHGDDWRATLRKIHEIYPYSRFDTNCPMVSNHAIILLGLLHGNDDFQRSLMITNTAGYDTDCNSGNVGCLLGIKNGLSAIDNSADWRGPVADRLYLPTADGGRSISDAVRESYELINAARISAGLDPCAPKDGARFHFSLPGSVQGFQAESSAEVRGAGLVRNDGGKLAISLDRVTLGRPVRVSTATFVPPEVLGMPHYELVASPTLYSGQTITVDILAKDIGGPVNCGLYISVYNHLNTTTILRAAPEKLMDGQSTTLSWTVPDTEGQPIAAVGIEVTADRPVSGDILIDRLTWHGTPEICLKRPLAGTVWRNAWVNAVEMLEVDWLPPGNEYRLIQNHGTGMISQGEGSWSNYTVSTNIQPRLSEGAALLAAVRGLRRYVALLLDRDYKVRIVEQFDDERRVLAELDAEWRLGERYVLSLTLAGGKVTAKFDLITAEALLTPNSSHGAVGLLVTQGHAVFSSVEVRPAG